MKRLAFDKLESSLEAIRAETKRQYDQNGWFEVKDNPISKVGIFPYLGSSIGAEEPDKIYMVLRPEEALSDPETLNSFRLVPFIDDHEMLGEGFTGAEEKGVGGVIGDEVYYKDGVIYGNLRVFSERLAQKIAAGKRELSAGYRCRYELTPGLWRGQHYDAIQLDLRGNHLALVDQGRMGPDVAVLDHLKITLDEKDVATMSKKLKLRQSLDELLSTAANIKVSLDALEDETTEDEEDPEKKAADEEEEPAKSEDEEDPEKKAADEEEEPAKSEDEEEEPKGMDALVKQVSKLAKGMDALGKRVDTIASRKGLDSADVFAEASKRDALVSKLVPHIGVFDHAKMTHAQVAKYAVKKLGIACDGGQEVAVLTGFLAAAQTAKPTPTLDSVDAPDFLSAYVA